MKNPNQPQTPVFVEGTNAQRWAVTWTPARESACLGLLAWALCQPCWTRERRGEVTVVALGKEGDCKWMCRNKEAVAEAKENGTETRLVPKKDGNYRGINSFVKPNFYHSFTYFCSFINPRTESLFCFFSLQDICPAVTGKTSLSNKLSKELVWKLLHRGRKSDLITSPI